MGLQEGLQIAQWLLNLNRQGQIDRENKAYQDRIIQQQDEQRRQEMATNDAISAMLAGSGEANDMFTQLPSLQNQAKILGTLQATGGMFGGPFSMMGRLKGRLQRRFRRRVLFCAKPRVVTCQAWPREGRKPA